MRPWNERSHAHDLEALLLLQPEVAAGELDRGLVRLGAAVGEEDAIAERSLADGGGQRVGLVVVEQVRDVAEAVRLVGDRPGEPRVRVADRVDRQAAGEVDVAPAVRVEEEGPLAPHHHDGRLAVGLEQVILPELEQRLVARRGLHPRGLPKPRAAVELPSARVHLEVRIRCAAPRPG